MALHHIESLVTGTVWKLERQVGDTLAEGETILLVESMKMEIPIDAPAAGLLTEVLVAEGESVSEGQVLAVLTA
ncbi:MAG: acetyl-CoA carboxylase biotin carboxyl carrier protein subunit [Rubrivivax sp.]